jgi:hypothetical protein
MTLTQKQKGGIAALAGAIIAALIALTRKAGAAPPPPPPQPGLASLYGLVTDAQTHAGIEGIQVTLNGYSTVTDQTGYYAIQNVAPGSYSVSFADPLGRYEPLTV